MPSQGRKSQTSLATGCAGINQAVTRNNFALKLNNLAASHRRDESRGYSEDEGEGLFSPSKISESLTHRFAVPPSAASGRGLLSTDISQSDLNVEPWRIHRVVRRLARRIH